MDYGEKRGKTFRKNGFILAVRIARILLSDRCAFLSSDWSSIDDGSGSNPGKKVTPVTLAAVVGEEKTVYAVRRIKTSLQHLRMLPGRLRRRQRMRADRQRRKCPVHRLVYGNAIGYITQTACQPSPWMTANDGRSPCSQQAEAVKQQVAQAQAAAQQAALAQAQAASIPAGSGNVIFVGDSRTGQMANAVGGTAAWPGTAFVACFGGGVDWLSTAQAKKDVDQYVTPGSVIILNYVVNDFITTQRLYYDD